MLKSSPLDDRLTVTSVTRLSEFLNLSKILKGLFGYALIVSIVFGKILYLFCQKNGKMQILIILNGHLLKNNLAIWLHWQQPISTYYLHNNVITFPSIHLTSKITQTLCDKELEDICWNLVLRSSVKLGRFMLKYNWWLIDRDQSVHTTYIPA